MVIKVAGVSIRNITQCLPPQFGEEHTPTQVSYDLLSCERKEIVWRSCGDPGDLRRPQVNGVLIRASMRYMAWDQPKKATAAAMPSTCTAVNENKVVAEHYGYCYFADLPEPFHARDTEPHVSVLDCTKILSRSGYIRGWLVALAPVHDSRQLQSVGGEGPAGDTGAGRRVRPG